MSKLSGSIIIVTHNSGDCISDCLRALVASEWEVVVVDNASEDDTAACVKASAVSVMVIDNERNAGFGAAVNQGVRAAKGKLLLILNPDTVVQAGALDQICQVFATPATAAAGGLLVDTNGLPQTGFVFRRFPRVVDMLSEVFLLNRLWPHNPWNRRYRCLDLDFTKQQEVDQPAGACLAFRREMWERIGGFDESFFPVWFEDVDFCRRVRDAGGSIVYTPQAVFTHAGAHSVGKISYADRQMYWYRNLLRYFRKHHGASAAGVLRIGIAAGLIFRSIIALLGVRPDGVPLREAVRAYMKVIRADLLREI
jgi:N-acetylglucosaminyl-diphospho-decaprenol L-rhamnosyltransferase